MTETLALEMDTPPDVYLSSREYTGQLVDRQLFRPLVRADHGVVTSELVDMLERPDAHRWVCRVRKEAKWQNGERVVAAEVVDRLLRVTTGSRGGWLSSLLERVESRDDRELSITTRFPVASLGHVLASPALAPRRNDTYSGNYWLAAATATESTLIPLDAGLPRVRLVTTATREEGHRRFLAGELDVCWGVGVPTEFWSEADDGQFGAAVPLDMYAVVVAGRAVPPQIAHAQLRGLCLAEGAVPGVEATSSRFAVSISVADDSPLRLSPPRALYYTPFPPNHSIAAELAELAEGRLVPTAISYEDLLSSSWPSDGFSLQIHATSFPGTLGLMPESIYLARGVPSARRELQDLACEAWASVTEAGAATASAAFEEDLDLLLRRRVVGRMLTRFRSAGPIEILRNGLFDFRQLTKRKDTT